MAKIIKIERGVETKNYIFLTVTRKRLFREDKEIVVVYSKDKFKSHVLAIDGSSSYHIVSSTVLEAFVESGEKEIKF